MANGDKAGRNRRRSAHPGDGGENKCAPDGFSATSGRLSGSVNLVFWFSKPISDKLQLRSSENANNSIDLKIMELKAAGWTRLKQIIRGRAAYSMLNAWSCEGDTDSLSLIT
jgi:hypothetical protein